MLKLFLILLSISQVFLLTCPENEKSYQYSSINTDSSLTTTVCSPCGPHQKTCKGDIECFDGYYLNNETCKDELDKPANCKKVNSSGNCAGCDEGYWLNDEYNCIKKSSEYLEKCSEWEEDESSETCLTLLSGYSYDEEDDSIITCRQFCHSCKNMSSCSECIDGYHLSDDNISCIESTGNCKTWLAQTDEECSECECDIENDQNENIYIKNKNLCFNQKCTCPSGYGYQYPNCSIKCSDNCNICSDADTCTKCNENFYLTDEHTCVSCPDFCKECDKATPEVCTTCQSGYFKNADNDCEECPQNCITCTSGTVCETCDSSTTLISNLCQTGIANCKNSDNDTTCNNCKTGYFLVVSETETQCIQCDNNCKTCESATACEECLDGYYLSDEKTCIQCDPALNCQKCSSGTKCTECKENYLFHLKDKLNTVCVPCSENLARYQKMECESDQWIKYPWECADMTGNCITVENAGPLEQFTVEQQYDIQYCSKCEAGYNLVDNACEKCTIEHCIDCTDGTDGCKTCEAGYYTETNLNCIACMNNCDQCTNGITCLDCKTGFTFNNDLSECVECSVTNCEWCSTIDVCVKCSSSYFLNSSYQCTACKSTCQECYDEVQCFQCKDTYYMENYQCFSCIENCLNCENNSTCSTCNDGFIKNVAATLCMNETLCKGNSPNCKTCNALDTVYCFECNDYYYLDEKICKPCLDNCKTCVNDETCKECKEGYELNIQNTQCNEKTTNEASCFSLIEGCIQCNTDNLLQCAFCAQGSIPTDSGTCVCSEGYYLISGSCVKQTQLTIDFDSLSSTTLETLETYIDQATYGSTKANKTEKVLKQVKAEISTVEEENAQKAAGLLLALAMTTTNLDAQEYYKDILKNICQTKGLSTNVYYTSMAAADIFYPISNSTMRQDVYDYGFSNCIKNYLTKAKPTEIPLIQFSNSQLMIKEIEVNVNENQDQSYVFPDAEVIATSDLKAYLNEKSSTNNYYMVVQAINNNANPYKYVQNNTILFESKIINVNIMQKEGDSDDNAPTLVDVNMGSERRFNITFDFEGTKCGSYNEDKLEWQFDGSATEKNCTFNHTTAFVIYQQPQEVDSANAANIMKILTFAWILFFVLF